MERTNATKYLRAQDSVNILRSGNFVLFLDLVIQLTTASSLITEGIRSMDTSAGRLVIDLDCVSMGRWVRQAFEPNTAFHTQTAMSYSTMVPCVVERHADKNSYGGGCARADDRRVR